MAYSDDAVRAKLNSLNETQDSIVAHAQWIMFHRRHADRTASLWLSRLQDSPMSKRLNLIYLANEVVQQSRARGKTDFLLAFEPVISDATFLAYKGASSDVQNKIRRVTEVWRQRAIFDARILDSVDERMAEVDKSKGSKTGGKLGGSLFGGSGGGVPAELEGVAKSQAASTKAEAVARPAISTANTEYAKLMDDDAPVPSPPVHAARLSALMKNLASAQGAVEASINARKEVLSGLEKLIESHRTRLADDEKVLSSILTRKDGVEDKKREVEDGIMRGLSAADTPTATEQTNGTHDGDFAAPEAEAFTPPEIEPLTPPPAHDTIMDDSTQHLNQNGTAAQKSNSNPTGAEMVHEYPPKLDEPPPTFEPPPAIPSETLDRVRSASNEIPTSALEGGASDPRLKRRKMSHPSSAPPDMDEVIFGSADGGVDEDGITAMLGQ